MKQRNRLSHSSGASVVFIALTAVFLVWQRPTGAQDPCQLDPCAEECSAASVIYKENYCFAANWTPRFQEPWSARYWDLDGADVVDAEGSLKAGSGDPSLQGFAREFSVSKDAVDAAARTIHFAIATDAINYHLDIYRMGYYGGHGARFIQSIVPPAGPANWDSANDRPQACDPTDPTTPNKDSALQPTGLIDCANWATTAQWVVDPWLTSGIYFAKVIRDSDPTKASHIFFVVRHDNSNAGVLFQTSDSTWQAYNAYSPVGSPSLYGPTGDRAYKVSYNRPFNTRGNGSWDSWVFAAEYPMVRWLEKHGYEVSYMSGADTERLGNLLSQHKAFLPVGHDEYWSKGQRDAVENALAAGTHLAFFSGNEAYWKTRWESDYRTLVSYKETSGATCRTCGGTLEYDAQGKYTCTNASAGCSYGIYAKVDPEPPSGTLFWTGLWSDGRRVTPDGSLAPLLRPDGSPPPAGHDNDPVKPTNQLTGLSFAIASSGAAAVAVTEPLKQNRFWRYTSVKDLSAGQSAVFTKGTLGHEFDTDAVNASRPAGLIQLTSSNVCLKGDAFPFGDAGRGHSYKNVAALPYDFTMRIGSVRHNAVLRKAPSGALVFAAGAIRWSWGLDERHDYGLIPVAERPYTADIRMQQATVNLFADMGVWPWLPTLLACTPGQTVVGAVCLPPTATDVVAPTISNPTISAGPYYSSIPITVQGGASDDGGTVGGVEVSVDGGTTWKPAVGLESWFYRTRLSPGTTTFLIRAIDDSGNVGGSVSLGPISVTASLSTVTVGVRRGVQWYLRNSNDEGPNDITFPYGDSTDIPVTGDWDGDGLQTIGVVRKQNGGLFWYLRNTNNQGEHHVLIAFGMDTDIPVTGDWDGDGRTDVGVYRPSASRWFLRESDSCVVTIDYGAVNAIPVTGDWDGDGVSSIGYVAVSQGPALVWHLRNSNLPPDAEHPDEIGPFVYGQSPYDSPITGDWDGDGKTTVGLVRYDPNGPTRWWVLRNSNDAGPPTISQFRYGLPSDTPVVGNWDGR